MNGGPQETVRMAFLGALQQRRKCSWRAEVESAAEQVFSSRARRRAERWLGRRFGALVPGTSVDLRLAGYSWGAWTAVELLTRLLRQEAQAANGVRIESIRLGLLDPVGTFRRRIVLPRDPRLVAWNIFQTNGCYVGGPGPSRWYRGTAIEGAANRDVTLEGRAQPPRDGVPPTRAPDHIQLGYRAWGGHGRSIAGVLAGRDPW